jgi:hypothetical protein
MQVIDEGRAKPQTTLALVDVSVEFAHVYGDETFGPEHLAGLLETKRLRRNLDSAGQTSSLVVLIDDYNPGTVSLDPEGFAGTLMRHGAAPDHLVLESSLAETAMFLLDCVDGRERRGLRRYIESRGRIPCALLLAAWHLVRLGAMPLPLEADKTRAVFTDMPLVAKESLTVLPARFADVEKRALEIIESTPFHQVRPRISHHFFETA